MKDFKIIQDGDLRIAICAENLSSASIGIICYVDLDVLVRKIGWGSQMDRTVVIRRVLLYGSLLLLSLFIRTPVRRRRCPPITSPLPMYKCYEKTC